MPDPKVEGTPPVPQPTIDPPKGQSHLREWVVIGAVTLVVLAAGGGFLWHSERGVNREALGESAQPVSVVEAKASTYRQHRSYVGAVQPWVEAHIGPQFISAYVERVLVRPGASVAKGQIVATLDCSNANAASRAAEMESRAVDARSRAMTDETNRMLAMVDSGYASANEGEQTASRSSEEEAQLLETKARLLSATLNVHDCFLRAPFEGEVATRLVDPGAFVRPGTEILSLVDRKAVRVVVDAPEKDFDALTPSTPVRIHLLATDVRLSAPISRRAPQADFHSRTIHFEVDLPDPNRRYPVGTTALVEVDLGSPAPATEVPLYAATEEEDKAKLFVVEKNHAQLRSVTVIGESGGSLFVDPKQLPEHELVVTEGRALLTSGDLVTAEVEVPVLSDGGAGPARGGGYGRPL